MFFVSEEFLRDYESGEEPESTLEEVVPAGQALFEKDQPKASGD